MNSIWLAENSASFSFLFSLGRNHEPSPTEKAALEQAKVLLPINYALCFWGHFYAFPLQKDCKLENCENEEEQERLKGAAVQYGQKVQVYTSMLGFNTERDPIYYRERLHCCANYGMLEREADMLSVHLLYTQIQHFL